MNTSRHDALRAALLDAISSIAPEVDPATIVPDRPLREQVDLDSMDFLNVIVRLHEILGVEVPESDYGELATLDAAVAYLARREGAPAGSA